MPHAATIAYASDRQGVYFAMPESEITLKNIAANKWASFTIDDYTPDFRKVRELRGVGRSGPADVDAAERARFLFSTKLKEMPQESLANMHLIRPLELHFVDYEYTAGVAVPMESTKVYASDTGAVPAPFSTQLDHLVLASPTGGQPSTTGGPSFPAGGQPSANGGVSSPAAGAPSTTGGAA